MKKNIITLKHPQHLYIKNLIFKNKRKKSMLQQLNQENIDAILNNLRLGEIVLLHESLKNSSKHADARRFIINYLILTNRAFTKWEEKEFLDFILLQLITQPSQNHLRRINNRQSRTSYKSHNLASSISMANLDTSSNDHSRLTRFRECIGYDVERTYLLYHENGKRNHQVRGLENESEPVNSMGSSNSRWVSVNKIEVEKMQDYLNRVLLNISKHFSKMGYVQGFNYIVKNMFITGFTELEAYNYMCYLISEKGLGEAISGNMAGIRELSYVLKVYIFNYVPSVYRYLEKSQIQPELFATSWFVTLFSQDFESAIVNKLWHLFILEGWKIFIQFGISVLCVYQQEILSKQYDEIFCFLRRLMSKFSIDRKKSPHLNDTVWKLMASVDVNQKMVQQLCRQMNILERDSEIQIWRIKPHYRKRTMSEKSLPAFTPYCPSVQENLGSQICCDRTSTAPYENNYVFPFCHNVGQQK